LSAKGIPLGKVCLAKTSWPQSNHSKAKCQPHLNMRKGKEEDDMKEQEIFSPI
jgi:hypothetical protein